MVTLGVVADTHIPDRMAALPPATFDLLRGVDAILHAGDLSTWRVVDELRALAPVHVVRGNRDLFFRRLPLDQVLTFEGVRVGLTHGHGGWWGYLEEKWYYHTVGYHLDRFKHRVLTRFHDVQAIVFGHSHRAANERVGNVLLFNPGALGPSYYAPHHGPTVGKLYIAGGTVRGEIMLLPGSGQATDAKLLDARQAL